MSEKKTNQEYLQEIQKELMADESWELLKEMRFWLMGDISWDLLYM